MAERVPGDVTVWILVSFWQKAVKVQMTCTIGHSVVFDLLGAWRCIDKKLPKISILLQANNMVSTWNNMKVSKLTQLSFMCKLFLRKQICFEREKVCWLRMYHSNVWGQTFFFLSFFFFKFYSTLLSIHQWIPKKINHRFHKNIKKLNCFQHWW